MTGKGKEKGGLAGKGTGRRQEGELQGGALATGNGIGSDGSEIVIVRGAGSEMQKHG